MKSQTDHLHTEHRAAIRYLSKLRHELAAGFYFLEHGWQQRPDARLYPPKGNHSMSVQDAVCQYAMVGDGEGVPF